MLQTFDLPSGGRQVERPVSQPNSQRAIVKISVSAAARFGSFDIATDEYGENPVVLFIQTSAS